jgi:hypothetical protein
VVGAGGVIFYPKGNIELCYAWSLGRVTNNQSEEYDLLKGVQLAKERQIQKLIILDRLKEYNYMFCERICAKGCLIGRYSKDNTT